MIQFGNSIAQEPGDAGTALFPEDTLIAAGMRAAADFWQGFKMLLCHLFHAAGEFSDELHWHSAREWQS